VDQGRRPASHTPRSLPPRKIGGMIAITTTRTTKGGGEGVRAVDPPPGARPSPGGARRGRGATRSLEAVSHRPARRPEARHPAAHPLHQLRDVAGELGEGARGRGGRGGRGDGWRRRRTGRGHGTPLDRLDPGHVPLLQAHDAAEDLEAIVLADLPVPGGPQLFPVLQMDDEQGVLLDRLGGTPGDRKGRGPQPQEEADGHHQAPGRNARRPRRGRFWSGAFQGDSRPQVALAVPYGKLHATAGSVSLPPPARPPCFRGRQRSQQAEGLMGPSTRSQSPWRPTSRKETQAPHRRSRSAGR